MITLSLGEQCKSLVNLDPTPISSLDDTRGQRAHWQHVLDRGGTAPQDVTQLLGPCRRAEEISWNAKLRRHQPQSIYLYRKSVRDSDRCNRNNAKPV